jgi:hypothetical protein
MKERSEVMKEKTLSKFGGTCSILVGVSYVLITITYLLLPAGQKVGAPPAQYFPSFARNPTLAVLLYWELALGALFAIGAVKAISELVRQENEGWVNWTSNLAYLGFAVTAINFLRGLAIVPERAAAYMVGDASTKAVIAAIGTGVVDLDPKAWFRFGVTGLWILVVNLLALRGGKLPKTLAYVGIAVAILYWFVVASYVLRIEMLTAIAAGLGGIIAGPVWYIWMGLILRRAGS